MAQKITFQTSKIIKLNDFLRKELPLEVAKKIDLKDSQCEFSNSRGNSFLKKSFSLIIFEV